MSKFIFDLDETLVHGDLVSNTCTDLLRRNLIDRLYTNRDVRHYDLSDLPQLLKSRVIDTFSDPDYVWYKYPIPGTYYFLRVLEENEHEIGIVTARPRPIQSETTRFVRARFPDINFKLGITFVNTNEKIGDKGMPSKLLFLEKAEPDFYFDDNAEYCSQSKKLGIETYLISNKHTPWNHEFAARQRKLLDPVKALRNVSFFPETRIYYVKHEHASND